MKYNYSFEVTINLQYPFAPLLCSFGLRFPVGMLPKILLETPQSHRIPTL